MCSNDLMSSSVVAPSELDVPLPQKEGEDLLGESARIKCVWYLHVDVYCLNYDGNVIDASLLAIMAALRTGTV